MSPPLPRKLKDCRQPGEGSELLIVEGDSAAISVVAVRNDQSQAVLPIQGKPLNAWKATQSRVANNDKLQDIVQSFGAGWGDTLDLSKARYDRLVVLCDPDVDGIHIRSLLLLFFHRWMPDALAEGRVVTVIPPLWRVTGPGHEPETLLYTDPEFRKLELPNDDRIQRKRFRGLANIPPELLQRTSVNPETRRAFTLTQKHAEQTVASMERWKNS